MLKPVRRWFKWLGLLLLSALCCWVFHWGAIASEMRLYEIAQTPPTQLSTAATVEQGISAYQEGDFTGAIAIWQQVLSRINSDEDRAVVYANLALAYRQTGQLSEAIQTWEEAIALYRDRDEEDLEIAKLLAEQAQAYSDLGQHKRSIILLESALDILEEQPDPLTEAAIHGIFGNAYMALGNYDTAIASHEKSLAIARSSNSTRHIATALNNLGTAHLKQAERLYYQAEVADAEGDPQAKQLKQEEQENVARSRSLFEESITVAQQGKKLEEIRALLNLNRLLEKSFHQGLSENTDGEITSNQQRIEELLPLIPDSRQKAYATINLAESILDRADEKMLDRVVPLLEQALTIAQRIRDTKAQSFALGSLGKVYENNLKDFGRAMEYTQNALFVSQQVNAADSLYLWQWQSGRILKALNRPAAAISAYKHAIATLQSIRGDIISANKELQLDFREDVEPVYRQLIELLLTTPDTEAITSQGKAERTKSTLLAQNTSSSRLQEVVNTLESLKLAEVQNFFGDDCVQLALSRGGGTQESLASSNTAVIYSIVLGNQTTLVLQAPDGTQKKYTKTIDKDSIEEEITQLRFYLEERPAARYLPYAQAVYDWFIRPMEADLAAMKPNTLLFINDGVLRKIPMAALHDGEQFLIEKYPIAITPSINLTITRPLSRENLEALSLGLTVAKPPFAPLFNVKAEINAVQEILGGVKLIDEDFTQENLQTQLRAKSFPVVHLATHGKFGVDAQDTFLLGYDKPLTIEDIDNLLRTRRDREPVGLLTMSACQTAAGDNRSALGMAGVAVRAGVESALATLWFINDEATVPFIKEFYRQLLDSKLTKAEALRNAQLTMIADRNYSHPAIWSPFVLIGNWL
ncbi:CHAT domain-containing protein [Lusitaniella coriacea]|uniref:CHAT domain-containing protein n=1 Tax=Lusitaniella coriacea TaxID=1983105 RepID=UPI003CEC50B3